MIFIKELYTILADGQRMKKKTAISWQDERLKTFGALHFVVAFTVKCMDKHKVILVM
jgi:hypothetical protein